MSAIAVLQRLRLLEEIMRRLPIGLRRSRSRTSTAMNWMRGLRRKDDPSAASPWSEVKAKLGDRKRIRPEAQDDVRAAMAWYDGREPVG